MAKSSNGTVEAGEVSENAQPRSNRSYIVVPLPKEIKERFEAEAEAQDKPVGPYVARLLADAVGFEIPATVRAGRRKYPDTPEGQEARKAAQKARNQDRSATMRDLMKRFREAQARGLSPEEAAQEAANAQATVA